MRPKLVLVFRRDESLDTGVGFANERGAAGVQARTWLLAIDNAVGKGIGPLS
jgi:hypothetical protein